MAVAGAAASGVAVLSVTLATLRDLLLEEARFLYRVGDQVREIQRQLEIMESFLKEADARQHRDELVRTWVRQVRRLAYRTEDILETYAVEVESKKGKGVKNVLKRFSCILCECIDLHKVGEKIANIKSEITILNESRQTFGIRVLDGESSNEADKTQQLLRQTFPHKVEEYFVGRKEDIRQLVSLITDDERDHRVISLWGIGGLGKTTLAREIFNHRDAQRSFEGFAWVSITQQCKTNKVLQDILKQILGNEMHGDGDYRDLVTKLYKVLKDKRCLVVLDDVWKIDDWEILRRAFPIIEASSKILITTRIKEVAKQGFLYDLKTLIDEEGWELLWKKAFIKPKENATDQGKEPEKELKEKGSEIKDEPEEKDPEIEETFERIGKEIVRKCGYLPLAISALGGVLRDKSSLKEWEMVNGNIDSYLRKRESSEEASGSVQHVLALSYDELPYYLKPCFLYMGSYQEDEVIDTETMYQLWIAEGLVLSKHCGEGETMMDVAGRYLNELASRCMVEVEMDDLSIVPSFESCRLHDLMRDLCLAKGKEEDFFKVISIHGRELPTIDHSHVFDDGRRLGIYLSEVELSEVTNYKTLFEQVNGQFLRNFFVHNDSLGVIGSLDISDLKKFKLLRVLRLERCEFELPTEISQLIHLRYMSLLNSTVKELPSSMSNLPYLQTLDLRTIGEISLPNIFWKMKRLRHIYLPLNSKRGPEGLQFNDLSELESLHNFRFSTDEPLDLSQLVNLRSFSGRLENFASPQIIDQINHLRKIKWMLLQMFPSDFMIENDSDLVRKLLLCEKLNDLYIGSPIGKFPPYESKFCPNLTNLALQDSKMEEDPMQFLKKLPNLRSLQLFGDVFVGKEMVCNGMGFPELRELVLYDLPNWEKWRVDEGAMCKLSNLTIYKCPKLETITNGLNFSALKRFVLFYMPEEFTQKYTMLYEQERKKLDG